MGRRPVSYRDHEGRVNVRVTVPEEVWSVAVSVGHLHSRRLPMLRINSDERAGQYGMAALMKGIAELFKDGDAKWISDRDFAAALRQLQDENFGTIPSPAGAIDVSKLHRAPKLKSGFHGVYANGQGFRAMSKDFTGKPIAIGTFKSAEEAAFRRLTYHRANNLAYGELEEEMELWRSNTAQWGIHPQISDAQLIEEIKGHAQRFGIWDKIFGPTCVSIEPTYSSKLPKRDDVLAERRPSSKALPPAKLVAEPDVVELPESDVAPLVVGFDADDLPDSLK